MLEPRPVEVDVVVGGVALVGAGGAQLAGEQLDRDVVAGEVPPGQREEPLEERPRPTALGEQRALVGDPDVARGGPDVDPVERVARVAEERLVLLPPVEGVEVEDHVVGEVVGPEPGAGAVVDPDVHGVAVGGVDRERHGRVQQRRAVAEPDGPVLRCRPGRSRLQRQAEVVHRDGVRRHDPHRLHDQQRPVGTCDQLRPEPDRESLGDRLDAQLGEQPHHLLGQHDGHGTTVLRSRPAANGRPLTALPLLPGFRGSSLALLAPQPPVRRAPRTSTSGTSRSSHLNLRYGVTRHRRLRCEGRQA